VTTATAWTFYATKKQAAVPALSAVSRDASALTKKTLALTHQNLGFLGINHETIHNPASVIYIYTHESTHMYLEV
jgi:hypothetical protein